MATGANLSTHVAAFCAAAICVGLPPARILLGRHQNTCAPTFKRLVPLQANVGRRFFANRMGTRCCRAGEVVAANTPMNFDRNGLNAQQSRALGGSQSLPALSLVCKFRCSVLFAAVRTSRHTVGAQGLHRGSGSCWFSIESSRAQKQCPFLDALLPCFLATFLQACLASLLAFWLSVTGITWLRHQVLRTRSNIDHHVGAY